MRSFLEMGGVDIGGGREGGRGGGLVRRLVGLGMEVGGGGREGGRGGGGGGGGGLSFSSPAKKVCNV